MAACLLTALAAPAWAASVTFLGKFTASDGSGGDNFGYAVALSGTTALIGAQGDDDNGSGSGAAYLIDTVTLAETKLTPSDGSIGDNFGASVALSGSTALIGARYDDDNGASSGSAYLFDTGTLAETKLTASDGAMFDEFGYAVALSGSTALIGARHDGDNGFYSGSAYLFDTGTLAETKLTPSDGAMFDEFGSTVAIDGSTALVGAARDGDNGASSGSAYLFDTGTLAETKLTPGDGEASAQFGFSVALEGTTALVGAQFDDGNGSAYLLDTGTLAETKLTAGEAPENDRFGYAVALDGTTALVGAWGDDANGDDSGAAFLFNTTDGMLIAKLLAPDGVESDNFGLSVAVSGNLVLVGAPYADIGDNPGQGAAYLFRIEADGEVPLPAPAWLLLTGLGSLALLRRRR
ncbi:VPLPA-CTERM sorting domain-containing protein [Paralimibaculum aggregatum]|nr:VPLPA-CTERM sorting domain-containing protein [Limibaculum sp. NKW23]